MENFGIRLPISNSTSVVYVGLGLFSQKGDVEQFMKNNNLAKDRTFFDEELAKKYCKRAQDAGLIAEIERRITK